MTKQEVFDKVATHLMKQGARSYRTGTGCMYRRNGRKCAVGCLISDEAYHENLEGCDVEHISVVNALEESGVPVPLMADMLFDLQMVHDEKQPNEWPHELVRVANKFSLNVPSCVPVELA